MPRTALQVPVVFPPHEEPEKAFLWHFWEEELRAPAKLPASVCSTWGPGGTPVRSGLSASSSCGACSRNVSQKLPT